MATEVASAFVSLLPSARGFGAATDKAISPQLDAAGRSGGRRYGLAFKRGFVALALAGGAFIGNAISEASDVGEATNVVRVQFGKASKDILKFARSSDTAFGISQKNALSAAGTFGTFGKSAGLSGKELTKFSTRFIGLSADLASFKNTTPEESIEAIGAALRGESEPIRRYGVLLDDATLRQRALKLGLIETTKQALTPQQKVLAATAEIYRQTGDAQGDFARTSDGFANQQRILSAQFDTLSGRIGRVFVPIALVATKALNAMFKQFRPQIRELVPKVTAFVKSLTAGDLTKSSGTFGTIAAQAKKLVGSFKGGDFSGVGKDFRVIGDALRDAAPAFKDAAAQLPTIGDFANVSAVGIGFLSDNVGLLGKALPFLVAGFVAYKAAQAAANTAMLLSVPVRIAEVFALRAHTAALRANSGAAAATALTTRRASLATKVWTGIQRVFNLVLRANPIGLIITGIGLLIGALVLAYRRSETFRRIVDGAFRFVQRAASAAFGWIKNNWGLLLAILTGPFGLAVRAIAKNWDRIRDGVRNLIGDFRTAGSDLIQGLIDGITSKFSAVKGKMGELAGIIKGFLPGSPVKFGPLRSWNNGAAGERLLDLLALGLGRTGGVESAMSSLAGLIVITDPGVSVTDYGPGGPDGGSGGSVNFNGPVYTHDPFAVGEQARRGMIKANSLALVG